MADIEVKRYVSNSGKRINKTNYYSSSYYIITALINGETKEITPRVNNVDVDVENETILCQKNIMINNEILCRLYFYVNFDGKVTSLGFTNLDDALFLVELTRDEDEYPFQTFDKCVERLKENYLKKINKRVSKNYDICKRLALVKRVDENES